MRYYDTYDSMYSSPEETLVWILMIYLIILIVMGIFSLISYILKGIGMYTIARRQGRDNAWLAFVPFARTYLHGELGGSIRLKNRTIQSPGIWLLALPFIYGAAFTVVYLIFWVVGVGAILKLSDGYGYYGPSIGAGTVMGIIILFVIILVLSILYQGVYKVLGILVNHQILEKFTSKNMSIAHAVLCAVIPMYESICLFLMRNKPYNPGMEPEIRNPYNPYGQVPPNGPYYRGPVNPQQSDMYTQDMRAGDMEQQPEYFWRPVEEPAKPAVDEPMQPVQKTEESTGQPIILPTEAVLPTETAAQQENTAELKDMAAGAEDTTELEDMAAGADHTIEKE